MGPGVLLPVLLQPLPLALKFLHTALCNILRVFLCALPPAVRSPSCPTRRCRSPRRRRHWGCRGSPTRSANLPALAVTSAAAASEVTLPLQPAPQRSGRNHRWKALSLLLLPLRAQSHHCCRPNAAKETTLHKGCR